MDVDIEVLRNWSRLWRCPGCGSSLNIYRQRCLNCDMQHYFYCNGFNNYVVFFSPQDVVRSIKAADIIELNGQHKTFFIEPSGKLAHLVERNSFQQNFLIQGDNDEQGFEASDMDPQDSFNFFPDEDPEEVGMYSNKKSNVLIKAEEMFANIKGVALFPSKMDAFEGIRDVRFVNGENGVVTLVRCYLRDSRFSISREVAQTPIMRGIGAKGKKVEPPKVEHYAMNLVETSWVDNQGNRVVILPVATDGNVPSQGIVAMSEKHGLKRPVAFLNDLNDVIVLMLQTRNWQGCDFEFISAIRLEVKRESGEIIKKVILDCKKIFTNCKNWQEKFRQAVPENLLQAAITASQIATQIAEDTHGIGPVWLKPTPEDGQADAVVQKTVADKAVKSTKDGNGGNGHKGETIDTDAEAAAAQKKKSGAKAPKAKLTKAAFSS